MRFAVETWDPEYGIGADAEALEPTEAEVDPFVEHDERDWGPIRPDVTERPGSLVFVDGVRRFDARIWIEAGDGSVHPGVCASVAAGVVRCEGERAEVVAAEIRRGVFASANGATGPILTRHATYEFHPVAADTAEGLYLGVHNHMTALETEIGDVGADIAVFDGPLRGREQPGSVGYVKTQQVQYLPDELQRHTYRLDAGERTPLFLFTAGRFTKWSWYLRLPGPRSHPLSGIVRCEMPGLGSVSDAAGRADQISAVLPRFASEPHKDSRAPQNLYPIAGLERQMRRRLGDRELLERSLRIAAGRPGAATGMDGSQRS